MARLVGDKKAHIQRLTSLKSRIGKLLSYFEKLVNEFSNVKQHELKDAAHSYVRILTKLYNNFDIDDNVEADLHRELYALLFSASADTDYRHVVDTCNEFTTRGITSLNARLAAVNVEIDNAE